MTHASRCIVHMGMPKTGSTPIQESLSSGIPDVDFYHPDMGHSNHCGCVVAAFGAQPHRHHANHNLGIGEEQILSERPAVLQRLADEIRSTGTRTMVLSAEHVFNLRTAEAAALRAFFSHHACHVQLVGHARPIRGWSESWFTQAVSEPWPEVPKDTLAWVTRSRTYRPCIESKDEVFGREHVPGAGAALAEAELEAAPALAGR